VIGLMAMPHIEGEMDRVRNGVPELATQPVVQVVVSSLSAWKY